MLIPNRRVATLAPYQLADLSLTDAVCPIMLAQNESLRPPSPQVEQAISASLQHGNLYPNPVNPQLLNGLRKVHKLAGHALVLGAGSMELIGLIMRAFLNSGDEVLCGEYNYGYFAVATAAAGGAYRQVSELGFTVSVDNLLNGVNANTKILVVANPSNPTGTCISNQEIRRLREALPEDVLLLVDEAYGEFCNHFQEPLFDLVDQGNTLVLRTFSKAYGLAAMRLGWGFMPTPVAEQIYKIKNPNSTSTLSQLAALAALQDQAYMCATVAQTIQTRDYFCKQWQALGKGTVIPPSQTNFVLLPLASAQQVVKCDQALRHQGIVARPMKANLAHSIRITIGDAEAMDLCLEVLAGCL